MNGEANKVRVYAGVKWGFKDPSVILVGEHQLEEDRIVVVNEFYQAGVLIDDMVAMARELAQVHRVRKFFCDPKQPRFIEKFRKAKLKAWPVDDEELAGINLVAKRLRSRPPGLVISRECPNLVREFGLYRTSERDSNKPFRDRPLPLYNHAQDALRLLVLGMSYEAKPRVRWV